MDIGLVHKGVRMTSDEINGLGSRVNKVEQMEPRVSRNENDIQKIFIAMDKLPMKILGMISIPTILLAYQIFAK